MPAVSHRSSLPPPERLGHSPLICRWDTAFLRASSPWCFVSLGRLSLRVLSEGLETIKQL